MRIYKFVKWDIPKFEDIEETKLHEVYNKAERGEKLNREEKDYIFEKLQNNSYSRTGIPLLGYMFDFFEILNLYYVDSEVYGILKVYAPDKTSIRRYYKRVNNITQCLA